MVMNVKYFAGIALGLAALPLVFSSCTEDAVDRGPAALVLDFNTRWGGGDFQVQEVYTDQFGNRIRVDNFKSYVSMVKLFRSDGTEVLLEDFYLIDFKNDNRYTFNQVPEGSYNGMQFYLGVPPAYNKDQDPAQYPSSHPLSVAGSQGMFWHWNTGYIFTKFEGKADTTGTEGADLLHSFSFHVGDDPFLRVFESFDTPIMVERGKTTTVHANIQVDHILGNGGSDGIDLATDAITHTSGNTDLAKKFMDNFVGAITLE
jgi:hypothetical protein